MNKDRIIKLAQKIKEGTENDMLDWIPSSDANSYRLSLGSGIITIDYCPEPVMLPDFTYSPMYEMNVYNERNELIDNLSAFEESDKVFGLLSDIYKTAKSKYYKVDQTYESMFDALDYPV